MDYEANIGVCIRDHMGGCQTDGPFLGTLNIRCRIIVGTQKGTIILTTTNIKYVLPSPDLLWESLHEAHAKFGVRSLLVEGAM